MLELTFLGTGAAVPSRDRAMSCVAVKHGPSVVLFDCAEGTQRQLMLSQLSFMKVSAIFVTHMHGDHMLGLPGLLQTMGFSGRDRPLTVCGPVGFARSYGMLLGACEGELEYPVEVLELSPGDSVRVPGATVTAFATQHGTASVGYVYREDPLPGRFDKARAVELGLKPGPDFAAIQRGESVRGVSPDQIVGPERPGLSVAYTGDTVRLDSIAEACSGVNVLIHESTYASEEGELAAKNLHSTCRDAAETAASAGAGCLILTHISNRYNETDGLLAQSRSVFPETYVAADMDRFEVSASGVRQVSEDRRS